MALTDIKIEGIQGYAGAGLGLKGLANIQIISGKTDTEDTEDYEEKQKAFLELNNNILNNYEQLNKLQEELTKTQLAMQQASEILKPSYMAKYQSLLKQQNDLTNQMNNAITERDKIIQNQQLKNLQMSQPQPITQKPEEGMEQLDLQKSQNIQTQQPLPIMQAKQQIIPQTSIEETLPQQESKWKDIWDTIKLTSMNMWHNFKQYFTTLLPEILYPHLTEEDARAIENKYDLPTGAIKEENLNKVNTIYDRRREELKQAGQKAEQEFMQYLKEHPELQPREEWSEGVIETVKKNPKILLDPTYWAYVAAQSAIYSLAITGTTLGTAALTGNPVAGMMAGVAVATPMQSQELYNELIENGASEKDAARLAMMIGPVIAGVEVLGDLPFLASLSQPFKKMLYKNITSAVVNNLAAKGLIKAGQIYGSELGEELIQEGIIKGTVKTFNENIDIVKDMPEIAAQTLMAVTPMAILGTEKAVAQMMHGQQMRGTLSSTPGIQAEGELRALANAKTLQTLGSLYESERNRMSNAISQALGYAQYQPSLMGQALSGVSAMSPLATYSSDVANQQALANAQMQANWLGQQLSGLGALSDYGTYYTPQQYYQPGPLDYLLGIGGAIGSIF